jgi:hypothetical protein
MSLVQRLTPLEGTDREAPQSDALFNGYGTPGYGTITTPTYSLRHQPSHQRSLRHVLSYDAIPKPEEPSHATNPTGGLTQFKVSTLRRIGKHQIVLDFHTVTNNNPAQVCFTVLACWLASGIVFGFAALKPVLIDQGVYRELCTADELAEDVEVCYEQELRYATSEQQLFIAK